MAGKSSDEDRKAAIKRIVDEAPPLTTDQIVRLRRIFASMKEDR